MSAPDHPPVAFVIGAARSGTTWLARVLGAHPQVLSTYETHLFNAYIAPLLHTWRDHRRIAAEQAEQWNREAIPPDIAIGLPYVMDDNQFARSVQQFVEAVFTAAAASRPEAQVIVEKTPSHSTHVVDIDELTGGRALFVHIIRNGYDVVESTVHAGSGWASQWAPRDPATAARKWRAAVRGARQAAAFGDRYLELRYEDMRANPEQTLHTVFDLLGVDSSAETVTQALNRVDHGLFLGGVATTLFDGPFPEPHGFQRPDRDRRTDRNRVIVHAAIGDLLAELGYDDGPGNVDGLRRRAWLASSMVETNTQRATRLARRVRDDVRSRSGS